MQSLSRKITILGLLTALGILLGYIESLFIIPIRVPGIRLGISNIITVFCLYLFGPYEAFSVLISRVLLSGLMFGNGISILYSISGAIISLIVMSLAKRYLNFSVVGISVLGGVFHNIAQLVVATILVQNYSVLVYAPFLVMVGVIAGVIIGIISDLLIKRLGHLIERKGNS